MIVYSRDILIFNSEKKSPWIENMLTNTKEGPFYKFLIAENKYYVGEKVIISKDYSRIISLGKGCGLSIFID